MNPKRNAELQRKLTLPPAPRPPAELLERIKNDIPRYLEPEAKRSRFTRMLSFNMRVAAAVLVVLSSVVATIYLLEPEQQHLTSVAAKAPAPAKVATPYVDTTGTTAQLQVEIAEEQPASPKPVMQVANATRQASEVVETGRRRDEESGAGAPREEAAVGAVAGTVAPVAVADLAAPPPPPAAAPAPASAPAVSEPQPAMARAEAPAAAQRSVAKFAAPSLVSEAVAADFDLGPKSTVFGITSDPGVFHRIRETLEQSERPTASAADLEAIVNYFAGPPASNVRERVRLDVEASRSPVDFVSTHGFVRLTLDTASSRTNLPVASDAQLTVTFDEKAVERVQPVGDSAAGGAEKALLNNLSVTGLYEVSLRSGLKPGDRVATVTLTYTDVGNGNRIKVDRGVFARDFGKPWTRASRRHRLASLGAVWGQSLQDASSGPDVARRAGELAEEQPADRRAQELATAATASSKLAGGF